MNKMYYTISVDGYESNDELQYLENVSEWKLAGP